MAKFVLWGLYSDDALDRRTPFREQHLEGLKKLKESGLLVSLGPTEGSSHVFGIFEADSQQQVEELIEGDIYWRNGIWTAFKIYPWIQVF